MLKWIKSLFVQEQELPRPPLPKRAKAPVYILPARRNKHLEGKVAVKITEVRE